MSRNKMSRVDVVKQKYPKLVNKALDVADPAHKNKYLLWIASQLNNKHNVSDIKATVKAFNDNPKRFKFNDIYKYEDLKTLEDEVKALSPSKRQITKEIKFDGVLKMYEDDKCICYRIDDRYAAEKYCSGTKWCITSKETYFEDYLDEGNLFYLIISKLKNLKSMLVFSNDSEFYYCDIYDEKDNSYNIYDFLRIRPEILGCIVYLSGCKHAKSQFRKFCDIEMSKKDGIEYYNSLHPLTKKYFDDQVSNGKEPYISKIEDTNYYFIYQLSKIDKEYAEDVMNTTSIKSSLKIKIVEIYPSFKKYLSNKELISLDKREAAKIKAEEKKKEAKIKKQKAAAEKKEKQNSILKLKKIYKNYENKNPNDFINEVLNLNHEAVKFILKQINLSNVDNFVRTDAE